MEFLRSAGSGFLKSFKTTTGRNESKESIRHLVTQNLRHNRNAVKRLMGNARCFGFFPSCLAYTEVRRKHRVIFDERPDNRAPAAYERLHAS